MGFLFGLASALCFSVGAILFKLGQRRRPNDDGHLVGNSVNVAFIALFAAFVAWPRWSASGFAALVAGGVLGTVVGRWAMLRGIRLVGPTRTNTFQTATPISAAIAGWIVLGEGVSPLEAVGGAMTIAGLLRIVRSRDTDSNGSPAPLRSYLITSAAPLAFGLAFVLRKWGLERMPGAVSGALIGSGAGLIVLLVWDAARRRLGPLIRHTVADPPWPFLAAGVVTALALLTQFAALGRIPAWVVGILGGTTAIWTPFLSVAFLKQEEPITARLLANIALVFAGVVLIAIV